MASSGCRCGLCGIELELASTGRPARFCSKRCRQADYREQNVLVKLDVWRRRRRRIHLRLEAELERELADVDQPTWAERQEAHERARARALEAWPRPDAHQDWSSYVAAQRPREGRELDHDDETGVSSL